MRLSRLLLWVVDNAEALVAFILALLASALGVIGIASPNVIANATLLVLALLGFALVRDRWRRDASDHDIREAMTSAADSFRKLDHRIEVIQQLDEHVSSARRAMDELATIRILTGADITSALATAMRTTDRWIFKGGTGTYIRAVTLPTCVDNARRERRAITFRLEIVDPTSEPLCSRYARLRQSLSALPDGTGEIWTTQRTRKESYATVLAALWYRERFRLLDIEVALAPTITTFRFDLSSLGLIITQDDPRQPALLFSAGKFFYDCFSTELRNSFEQARRVPYHQAADISLSQEPVAGEVREMFSRLNMPVPDSYSDGDVDEIVNRAIHAKNPYA
ncbi:MAG TPA: hypothetical protein VIV12_27710 [Streptosporangiaceae bacterium]